MTLHHDGIIKIYFQKETFHHTSIVPLGLKRGDYVLKDLAMDMDEEEDSEIEEDDDDEELDQVSFMTFLLIHPGQRSSN